MTCLPQLSICLLLNVSITLYTIEAALIKSRTTGTPKIFGVLQLSDFERGASE